MKKGKTSKITGFKKCKVTYGTVDSIDFKTVYLNIQTWVEPIIHTDNFQRVVLNLSRSIKHTVLGNIHKTIFDNKFIVDLDLRSSGLLVGKKSFLNLEVTLFFNESTLEFKSKELKDELKKLTVKIVDENLEDNEYFVLHLRKNKKLEEV